MEFKERVQKELQAAMKAGDTIKRETLRTLLTTLTNAELEKQGALDESDIVAVVQREAKKRREAIEAFTAGGRQDRAATEEQELRILQGYLPKQLSDDDIRQIVQTTIDASSAQGTLNLGQVMGQVMGQVKGQADGNAVRKIVAELLET